MKRKLQEDGGEEEDQNLNCWNLKADEKYSLELLVIFLQAVFACDKFPSVNVSIVMSALTKEEKSIFMLNMCGEAKFARNNF